ncbi:MAG TPA: cytochrome c oxidase subunit II [Burkholderiaceae bacterium]|nr:cytochrome c oxidase subunit II [Burkholderiaceae bacterium]
MNNLFQKLAGASLAATAWMATAAHAVNDLPGGPAVNQLNLPPPVTRIAAEQHWLHWMMLILCSIIFVLVFSVMFYSIWKHRKSVGHKPASFHESVTVEIVWTIVPFVIVILMALPATKVLVAQKDTTNSDLTIKATGYQWKWGYDYLRGEGEGIGFLSTLDPAQRQLSNAGTPQGDNYLLKVDNPLVVPVNKKVRIITTATDVIHAFMVPSFGIKQDAIPGFVRDTWFRAEQTGDFYGQCAELCGKEHAYMPIHVKVLSADDYSAWVAAEKKKMAAKADDPSKVWALDDLVKRGEKVYAANCAACHQANGKGAGPIKALDGSPIVLGSYAEQMKSILDGRANGTMPAWKQLSDTDLAAVMTYTRNAWSNKTGQVIQPAMFLNARGGKFPDGGAMAGAAAAAPTAAVAPAPVAAAPTGMPYSIFFASGQSALDPEAQATLKAAADFLKANAAQKVVLSGFVDSTGNADQNAELAKKRAFAVRDALKAAGVDEARIDLQKPQAITAGQGSDREARRVEIKAAG